MLAAELGVPHARGIPLEVIRLCAELFEDFSMGGSEGAQRTHEFLDLSLVEQAFLVHLHPRFLLRLIMGEMVLSWEIATFSRSCTFDPRPAGGRSRHTRPDYRSH